MAKYYVGTFDTALEAALHVARFLGPKASSAAVASVKAAAAEAAKQGMSEAEVCLGGRA